MNEAKLNYVGPLSKPLSFDRPRPPWWKRLPLSFLAVVVAPTLLAALYFLVIATPRYVAEARFIVRQPNQSAPTSLGVALQGVGLSSGSSDAFAVHEYIRSRDGLRELNQKINVAAVIGPRGVDLLSRYPRPWESQSFEGLHEGFQRFVTVGYDSTTGISTLRVEAFRADDAQRMAEALLVGGESLVNRLNQRAAANAVSEAEVARDEARTRLASAQQQLTAFRNRERVIDPARMATESGSLIGQLLATVAQLRAERAQLAAEAPQSPQLPGLDNRIAAYDRQISAERAKIAGDNTSLAPLISVYEDLMLNREFADRELAAATAALVNAEQQARRQRLYLDRVVNPSIADEPAEPKRWLAILTVFASAMLIYGIGWLIWAGVREHRQD